MTQPPEERDPQAGTPPEQPAPPEDQPTVAWSPGASGAEPPDAPPPPPEPAAPSAAPPAGEPGAPPPASPIISASPAATPAEPAAWPQPEPAGPVVGWEMPGAAALAPGQEGYAIAGMGARLVAYLLDSVIVSIVPAVLSLLVVDWADLFRQMGDATVSPTTTTAITMEVTPQLILITLIGLAIQFIYFVGFWTSGWRATAAMRLLKMQVVDAATGGTLSLGAATKRFIAIGYPLTLLSLVPQLQSVASVLQFAVALFLFFTAITNDLRQGLHDKFASSLVIRSRTSGDGATVVGCLLLIGIVGVLAIVLSTLFFAAVGPELNDLIQDMENRV